MWEAQLRAREANELFSQNEIAGCQNVSPSLYISESLDYDEMLLWARGNSNRGTIFCMIPASSANGGVIASYDFFILVYFTLVLVLLPFLPFILHFIVNTC